MASINTMYKIRYKNINCNEALSPEDSITLYQYTPGRYEMVRYVGRPKEIYLEMINMLLHQHVFVTLEELLSILIQLTIYISGPSLFDATE